MKSCSAKSYPENERAGFKRYQFGNISENDEQLEDAGKNLNCRMVNSLVFMRHK